MRPSPLLGCTFAFLLSALGQTFGGRKSRNNKEKDSGNVCVGNECAWNGNGADVNLDDKLMLALDVDGDGEVSMEELDLAFAQLMNEHNTEDGVDQERFPRNMNTPFEIGKHIIYDDDGTTLRPIELAGKMPLKDSVKLREKIDSHKEQDSESSEFRGNTVKKHSGPRKGKKETVETSTYDEAPKRQPSVVFNPPRGRCGSLESGWWDGTWHKVLTKQEAPSVDSCCQACISDPACEFFNIQLTGNSECHLMREKGFFHPESNHKSAVIEEIPVVRMTANVKERVKPTNDKKKEKTLQGKNRQRLASVGRRNFKKRKIRRSALEHAFTPEDIEASKVLGENWKQILKYVAMETVDSSMKKYTGHLKNIYGVYNFQAVDRNNTRAFIGELELRKDGSVLYLPDERVYYGKGVGIWSLESDGFLVIYLDQVFHFKLPDLLPSHEPDSLIFIGCAVTSGKDPIISLSGLVFNTNGDPVGDGSGTRISGKRQISWPSYFAVSQSAQMEALKERLLFDSLPEFHFQPKSKLDLTKYEVREGGISGLYFIPNFLTEEDYNEILHQISYTPEEHWGDMRGSRKSIEWGTYTEDSPEYRGISYTDMPTWIKTISEALEDVGIFPEVLPVNTARLNYYVPGQGIPPHVDGDIYVPKVAMLSLRSTALFRFYFVGDDQRNETAKEIHGKLTAAAARGSMETASLLGTPALSLILRPKSLVVFEGEAAKLYAHGVAAATTEVLDSKRTGLLPNLHLVGAKEGETIQRGERTTITFRHILHT